MTAEEFNEKYKDFLEKGHYGCAVNRQLIPYLDKEFERLTKLPGFQYSQIKCKFGYYLIYAEYENDLNKEDEVIKVQSGLNKVANILNSISTIEVFHKWMLQNVGMQFGEYTLNGKFYTFEELFLLWVTEHSDREEFYKKN